MEENDKLNTVSKVFFNIACIGLVGLLLCWLLNTGSWSNMYANFGIDVSVFSRIFMSSFFPIFLIILLIALIIKERLQNKKITLIVNIFSLCIIGICFFLYVVAMFAPLLNLTK